MDARKGAYAGNPEPRARALGPRFRGDELMLYRLDAIPTHSSRALPIPFEAGLEALGEVAGCGLAHRAGDAERSAEQLLLGAERAQPLVVGAGNVGAERHAGVGRQEVEAQRLAGGPTVDLPRRSAASASLKRRSATSTRHRRRPARNGSAWCRACLAPARDRPACRSQPCPSRAAPRARAR